MSRVLGTATLDDLTRLRDTGLSPGQAIKALKEEARRRYPNETVVIIKSVAHDGYDIMAF